MAVPALQAGGAVISAIGSIVSPTLFQSRESRDRLRCTTAQTAMQMALSGQTGPVPGSNSPVDPITWINSQRTGSATAVGKACYQQAWDTLVSRGVINADGSRPKPPQLPTGMPASASTAMAAESEQNKEMDKAGADLMGFLFSPAGLVLLVLAFLMLRRG